MQHYLACGGVTRVSRSPKSAATVSGASAAVSPASGNRTLLPHGCLFLGQSESLYGINEDFRLVHMPSATAYVKSENPEINVLR